MIKKAFRALRFLLFLALVAGLTLLFSLYVARLGFVNGSSMENTLTQNQIVCIWQWNYQPQPGDVISTDPDNVLGVRLTKRVIACGGQHLRIQGSQVWVDGVLLDEPYLKEQDWDGGSLALTLPENSCFLMGDNRNYSTDSREIGPLPYEHLMGKIVFPDI